MSTECPGATLMLPGADASTDIPAADDFIPVQIKRRMRRSPEEITGNRCQ